MTEEPQLESVDRRGRYIKICGLENGLGEGEMMVVMNITQSQPSKDINVPANRVSQVIHGKREITADSALRLGKYFGIEPEFWLNLQVRYNAKTARSKVGKKLKKK